MRCGYAEVELYSVALEAVKEGWFIYCGWLFLDGHFAMFRCLRGERESKRVCRCERIELEFRG